MPPPEDRPVPWNSLRDSFLSVWPGKRWRDVGVVVGCSGGADSVALTRLLANPDPSAGELGIASETGQDARRGFVMVAHFNHRLRGDESDLDEQFVRTLAERQELPFVVGRADSVSTDESSLRSSRLAFLRETAERCGARYVTLAHSADDQAETVLHHLMRGTGPTGLAGIRTSRPLGDDLVLMRPLLTVRREAIRQGLRQIGQSWREDSSNQNVDYRRNWIRRELMPLIESQFPKACEAIARAGQSQREWCDWIDCLAEDWLESHHCGSGTCEFLIDPAANPNLLIAACQRWWLRQRWPQQDMTREHWRHLAEAVSGRETRRFDLPGGVEVRPSGDRVAFHRPPA